MQWAPDRNAPNHHDSVALFVNEGRPVGGFLTALLSNKLVDAYGAADVRNTDLLRSWADYLYNELPSPCWGSRGAVERWVKAGGFAGITNSDDPGAVLQELHSKRNKEARV